MKSYRLSVAVVGIFIAETADQSSYFEDPKVKIYQDDEKVNFTKALLDFGKWVSKRKPKEGELETEEIFLQEHDIAIAFTDYHEGSTKGLAILGSVCEDLAQGIVHSRGHYNTISTAAHEIGHVLGCEHDGDDSNDCNPADHYLMSPMMNFNKIDNWHKLSNCSIAEIVENVEKLERNGRNCLDSSKKHRKTEDLDKLLNSYPGVLFGPDEQCQLKFGDRYKFCSQGIDTNICNQMSCLNTEDNTCYKGYPIASDGTACGKGKWCINGNCVFGAPIKPGEKETCYFGDKSDIFLINGVPKRCNDVLNEPRLCYQLEEWCCETCEKIKSDKNISLATCAYGDKGIVFNVGSRKYGCELVFRRPDICLEPEDAEHCCESCLKVNKNSNLPGTSVDTPTDECEDDHSVIYNNIEITCASLLHDPAKCYGLEKYCCKTCAEVKIRKDINIPNCPYGDRGMIITVGNKRYGCELVYKRPDLCEKSKYEINCCESCDKAKKASSTPEAPGIDVEKPEEICKDNKNLVLENGEKFNCVSLLLYPGKCYQLNKYCCQTCATIQRANDYRLGPNCPYGDHDVKLEFNYKEYSCPALVRWYPHTCSDPQAAHYCCESCFRVNRN